MGSVGKGIAGKIEFMKITGVAIADSFNSKAVNSPSRQDVHLMFDRIARKYDLLNRIFSFGQDIVWRKKLARMLSRHKCAEVLDLATGTADVLISGFKHNIYMKTGVGIDMAGEMLRAGQRKIENSKLSGKTVLLRADALALPISDNSFDAITISFGIRNVVEVEKALKEMHRVLRAGGKCLILEFALPANSILRRMFLIYLRNFIPFIGGLLTHDKSAYRYLNQTVETFPCGEQFADIMRQVGFGDVRVKSMTFGVAMIYEGTK